MNIYEKLLEIQINLKAPKTNWSDFGGYHYRSTEDILEAVKPLLSKYRLTLVFSDSVELVGDRYYIKSEASLIDVEKKDFIKVAALAREEESKKKLDVSQVTGGCSSYARKYALNGLFAINDSKDSDFTNQGENIKNKQQYQQKQVNVPIIKNNSNKQHEKRFISTLQAKAMIDLANGDIAKVKEIIGKLGYKSSTEIEVKDYMKICEMIKGV